MSLRLYQIQAQAGHADTIVALAEEHEAVDIAVMAGQEDGRQAIRVLMVPGQRQSFLDAVQRQIGTTEGARIDVMRVEASIPTPKEPDQKEERTIASREELYDGIASGAQISWTYVLLVVLSTIVAAIGLVENNVAVVIGAMVIAPLLGPNLAFALSSAIGDVALMLQSLRANVLGLAIILVISVFIGLTFPDAMGSAEIMSRTQVGLAAIALALASGAAAALSMTSGLSSTLVGVMVAVALLPPAATMGMMIGSNQPSLALGAAMLLAVNIVSVNIVTQLVFYLQGVRPRTWLTAHSSRNARFLSIGVLVVLFVILVIAVTLGGGPQALAPS